jgi:3-hydroxyisobutyrate dehydrogenase-like beta-hydroxyacid dehydrogenase
MSETKRSRILKLIEAAPEFAGLPNDRFESAKMITYEMLSDADLNPTFEVGETYSDLHYVMKIARELGYKPLAGMALHLYKFKEAKSNAV